MIKRPGRIRTGNISPWVGQDLHLRFPGVAPGRVSFCATDPCVEQVLSGHSPRATYSQGEGRHSRCLPDRFRAGGILPAPWIQWESNPPGALSRRGPWTRVPVFPGCHRVYWPGGRPSFPRSPPAVGFLLLAFGY